MNRYPLWKYAVMLVALVIGLVYTLPNFFGEAPAVQVSSGKATVKLDSTTLSQVEAALASSQIKPDERKKSACAFLKAAVAYYASLGVTVERVMTDNGSCYRSKAFAKLCSRLGLKHVFTRPYTPKTNGKAERFIQTSLREWAYAKAYRTSEDRSHELPYWMHRYNWHRPHGSIGSKPPISRLGLTGNNLLSLHT